MASLQRKGDGWYCQFISSGKRHTFSVGRVTEAEAKAKGAQVDYLLMRLKQGLISLPSGIGVVEFMRHDGLPPLIESASPESAGAESKPILGDLRDRYLETHGNGSLGVHTLKGIRRHLGYRTRILGQGFPIRELRLADLQGYVEKRARAKGRRGSSSPCHDQKRKAHDGLQGGASKRPIRVPNSLLPRALTLWTNSKKPR